jgi:hypothetical protein
MVKITASYEMKGLNQIKKGGQLAAFYFRVKRKVNLELQKV